MIEFANRNLERTQPDYFYTVWEFLTTFGEHEENREPFSIEKTFKGNDLLKCRKEALKYYQERLKGIEEHGTYFLPFAAYKDFEIGKNAAYSITLSLVEYYNDDNQTEYCLIGGDIAEIAESVNFERSLLEEKGLL